METSKNQALTHLSRIRFLLLEATRRRLSLAEAEALAMAVIELSESVDADAFSLRHIELLESQVQQEFCLEWPGSKTTREDAILTAHVLSGHLWSA
ncbi:MAG: hypothetical protein JWO94_511 [Verrucomicrobiaceae bacterium]|nr:hypothetical protein [Verrucomicrobiaceae bacterium]